MSISFKQILNRDLSSILMILKFQPLIANNVIIVILDINWVTFAQIFYTTFAFYSYYSLILNALIRK